MELTASCFSSHLTLLAQYSHTKYSQVGTKFSQKKLPTSIINCIQLHKMSNFVLWWRIHSQIPQNYSGSGRRCSTTLHRPCAGNNDINSPAVVEVMIQTWGTSNSCQMVSPPKIRPELRTICPAWDLHVSTHPRSLLCPGKVQKM